MAVEHIKIHQIHKGQALEIPGLQCLGEGDAIGVAGGLDLFGHALSVKDIKDLAHGDDIPAGLLQQVEHGGTGRLQAQVVAVGGTVEGLGAAAQEGPGDDTAHAVRALQHLTGDLAVAVKLVHGHQLLVGSHLEHAVGAGVDNEGIFLHGLLAVVLQHLGAGIGQIAEDFVAGFGLKLLNELLREAVGEGGQRVRADHTGNLPVADGGILAHALLLQAGKGTGGRVGLFARSHTVNVEQAQLFQVGAVEIGMPCNGPQRVGALVAKGGCIRLRADAKAVQHDQKYTLFHMFSLHFPPGLPPEQSHFCLPSL